jgi:hypothetical protein
VTFIFSQKPACNFRNSQNHTQSVFKVGETRRYSITKLAERQLGKASGGKNKMRKGFIFLNLIGLLLTINQTFANPKAFVEIPVESVEVKDMGLSDRDETKSVIEVRWTADSIQKEKIVSFNLVLSVTYADGREDTSRQTSGFYQKTRRQSNRRAFQKLKNKNQKIRR